MLSFKNGKDIAIIRGGSKNGKVLKINDGLNKDRPDYDVKNKKLKKYDVSQLELLKDSLEKNNDKYLTGDLKKLYNKIKNKGDIGKTINVEDGMVKIFPTNEKDQRDSIYITGMIYKELLLVLDLYLYNLNIFLHKTVMVEVLKKVLLLISHLNCLLINLISYMNHPYID